MNRPTSGVQKITDVSSVYNLHCTCTNIKYASCIILSYNDACTNEKIRSCRQTAIYTTIAGALKMTDMKMTDQTARHENAGHEIARHDKYLFVVVSANPSNFSSIVENLM